MAKITIKNVGPIKKAELELNKINVFMGPQSSGKSTIAKLISYCTWVEKDVATAQSLEEYKKNNNYFIERLESFHKLKGYFNNSNREITYTSDVIIINYNANSFSIDWIDRYAYKRSKISYIPSERNMVILQEIRKVEFSNTNIRSFLFDWFDARQNYTKENRLFLPKLSVDYYYSQSSDTNHITHIQNGDSYDILLENASSGLQSVTPLIASIDYLTNLFYKQEKGTSYEEEQKRKKTIGIISNSILGISTEEFSKYLVNKIEPNKEVEKVFNIVNNLFNTQNTNFIIEEPEQNLFPATQRDLIYHLLEKIQSNDKEHSLTITTHSPYILYALNNCMLGGLVNSQLDDITEKEDFLNNNFLSKNGWIDPKVVSIWEIEDGKLRDIQDEDKIISKNYFDTKMSELMDEYYLILNYYKDEDER